MDTATTASDPTPSIDHAGAPERQLRTVLRVNAGSSAATALLLLIAAGPVGELIGVDATGAVRAVGAGLVFFAAAVGVLAGARDHVLLRGTPLVVAGDAAWVVATVATVAAGWYRGAGVALTAVVAVVVGALGAGQWVCWRRATARRRVD